MSNFTLTPVLAHTFEQIVLMSKNDVIPVPERMEPMPKFIPTNGKPLLNTFKAFYKKGTLYNVEPRNKRVSLDEDRQTAYDARYVISDSSLYDLEDPVSIASIHIPRFNQIDGMPYVTRDLTYILKMRVGIEYRPLLAVPLAYKVASMMLLSPISWSKKDFYRIVIQLWEIGEFKYGDHLLTQIKNRAPHVAADDEVVYNRLKAFDTNLHRFDDINYKTDYVETDHFAAVCENCAPYRSRVYSISGNDKRFPRLPSFILANKGLHCDISFYGMLPPYKGYTLSVRGSDGGEIEVDAIKYSNRPFVDDRTEEEKAAYLEHLSDMEKKKKNDEYYYSRQAHVDSYYARQEYQALINAFGDKAPKSYSGFKRMKNNNTANYQKLIKMLSDIEKN